MHNEYDVAVAGAGPVGATLAIDLARRGVRTLLLERATTPRRLPKMERCNARTMEMYRRLGLADTFRRASRFTPEPMDVFVVADFSFPPLAHLRYPSVPEAQARIAASTDGAMPLEPQQLISQYTVEPILREAAQASGAVLQYGAEVIGFAQDRDGVDISVSAADGTVRQVRASWLVGCDGGVSTVRKQLGIALEGRGRIRRVHQVFFRSEQLYQRIPYGRGRHYYFAEGAIVVQDDLRHFMFNFADWQPGDDARARLHKQIGFDVDIEVLHEGDWYHHLLVAERYRDGRVFIAGDSAHLVIPQGALGMNTGVGDAIDLAWKLAGTVAGWGGPALLDSYDAERREIGLRNRQASGEAAGSVAKWRSAVTPAIRAVGSEGEAVRKQVAALAVEYQPISHELLGIELGYRYTKSPIIALEPDNAEHSGLRDYRPTASPGARLPHVWRANGSAVQDALGPGYTMLCLGCQSPNALVEAMKRLGAPIEVVSMPEPRLRAVYEHELLLIRPDLHVTWRGDRLPEDVDAVARLATGNMPT